MVRLHISSARWFRSGRVLLLIALVLILSMLVIVPAVSAQQSEPPLLPAPDHDMNNGPWFQMVCTLGDRRHDDPIVFPGQPGVSHEHQFFGAKSVTAFGSYAKLSTGGTTCNDKADTAAYWVPVLYDEQGVVRSPKRVRAYYFANTSDRNTLRAFPPNLRIIAGDGRATSTQPQGVIHWQCRNRRDQSAGRPLASANPPRCDRDEYLSLGIRFPDCYGIRRHANALSVDTPCQTPQAASEHHL